MRELLTLLLAHVYFALLEWGPIIAAFAIALLRAHRFEQHEKYVRAARAAYLPAPRTHDEAMADKAEVERLLNRRRHRGVTFALFVVVLSGGYALSGFIRYNAHNIVREAHKISEAYEARD
ncbi:Uncharacterised protein [Starkeya nomas]|uniref:Uncharacterized protein n=1 Tax=Starkeya nomas TaxID=2666134 RepID=A0A5S9NYW2_9HYPH|nr:hypothetical protein [Starkeya nomas]CAA0096057.1 Uncharacterised protein [Starkeya nomas]